MRKPPSKELLLTYAEYYFDKGLLAVSMDYLVCWGFYEMYTEGWWQE